MTIQAYTKKGYVYITIHVHVYIYMYTSFDDMSPCNYRALSGQYQYRAVSVVWLYIYTCMYIYTTIPLIHAYIYHYTTSSDTSSCNYRAYTCIYIHNYTSYTCIHTSPSTIFRYEFVPFQSPSSQTRTQ